MRLGRQDCLLEPGSMARQIYEQDRVMERHRHRYG
jgi:CTP synthase